MFSFHAGDTCLRNALHKQQSLPLRPVIPLVARISDQNASGAPPMTVREKTRLEKFRQLLSSHSPDLDELRKCSWPGVPREVRPVSWRLLSGYLPANAERRTPTLQRKREEYFGFIEQYYDSRNEEHHQDTYRQIFERILFIWASDTLPVGMSRALMTWSLRSLSSSSQNMWVRSMSTKLSKLSLLSSVCFSQECSQ
ncbi:TBC1 domain family member 22B-like isoform X3 [Rhinolophus ferrumequinum]|uniref:TBC1 domain family member 22B-like isoform X3 n=1 Tax=Rhinolophus ferrumequinum TaxID=59479 RepID=UPI00140F58AB|nr:TBC1 domain family member 22B-like isoform X3 [Rhinolophus ferrumequinum]